jgi:hypothetical protein
LVLVTLGLVFLISCGSSREVSTEDLARLDSIVEHRYFEIEAQFARPLTTNALNQLDKVGLYRPGDNASQISLQGNSNYFRFEGDTVSSNLPYYGERQFGGAYGTASGVDFKGVPSDLKIAKDDDKHLYTIKFDIRQESENYQVTLTLYSSLKAFINVNSNQRFPIRYDGTLKMLNKE